MHSARFVKMPEAEGFLDVRFLPPLLGSPLFVSARVHYINGYKLLCRYRREAGQWVGECPICEWVSRLWSSIRQCDRRPRIRERLKFEAFQMKPIERNDCSVIVRGQEEEGIQTFSCGATVYNEMILRGIQELGDVTDILEGRDFRVYHRRIGGYPDYRRSSFLAPSKLGTTAQVEGWLEDRRDQSFVEVSFQGLEFAMHLYCEEDKLGLQSLQVN